MTLRVASSILAVFWEHEGQTFQRPQEILRLETSKGREPEWKSKAVESFWFCERQECNSKFRGKLVSKQRWKKKALCKRWWIFIAFWGTDWQVKMSPRNQRNDFTATSHRDAEANSTDMLIILFGMPGFLGHHCYPQMADMIIDYPPIIWIVPKLLIKCWSWANSNVDKRRVVGELSQHSVLVGPHVSAHPNITGIFRPLKQVDRINRAFIVSFIRPTAHLSLFFLRFSCFLCHTKTLGPLELSLAKAVWTFVGIGSFLRDASF